MSKLKCRKLRWNISLATSHNQTRNLSKAIGKKPLHVMVMWLKKKQK